MDADHFDALTRSLSAAGSRRRALAASLGGALGLVGLAETQAGKGKGKGKKKKKRKKKAVTVPPPPPLPAPTCGDGLHNGTETDVDCGGNCARCTNGRRCLNSNDCANACKGGTCQACATGSECGSDGGGQCSCARVANGGPGVCYSTEHLTPGDITDECGNCPSGTMCVTVPPDPNTLFCLKPCGAV